MNQCSSKFRIECKTKKQETLLAAGKEDNHQQRKVNYRRCVQKMTELSQYHSVYTKACSD